MSNALKALQSLTSNVNGPDSQIEGYLLQQRRLQEMKRNLELAAGSKTFGTGATQADVEDTEQSIAEDPYAGTLAHQKTADAEALNFSLQSWNRPDVTAKREQEQAAKVQLSAAPAEAQARGAVNVEDAKVKGQIQLQQNQQDNTRKLLETLGGGGNGQNGGVMGSNAAAGTTVKPTINASGGVSFTTTQMPALVQRARNQLLDARDKTLGALQEIERLQPGINDSADTVDAHPSSPGWGSFLTGMGSPKYGAASDMAGAANERLKYTLGLPTPYSKLAQEASFGNIEQMAGQLPGVRGLATITPLFKEHQSRWGKETPVATVQRLRHMAQIIDQTLNTIDTGGANEPVMPGVQ